MSCRKADYSLLVAVSVNIAEFEVAVEVFLSRCRIRMPLFVVMWIEVAFAVGVVAFAVGVVEVAFAVAGLAVAGAFVVEVVAFALLGLVLLLELMLSALLLSKGLGIHTALFHIQACWPLSSAVSWLLFAAASFLLIIYSARSAISCIQILLRRRRIFYQMFEEVCLCLCLASPELFCRFLIPYCHQPLGTCF